MKVIEETFVKGQSRKEVITVGKKKFIRVASSSGVDWRRYKTNHQVKKSEFEGLEQEYQTKFPKDFVPSSFIAPLPAKFVIPLPAKRALSLENDDDRRKLERGLVEASNDGAALLMGVKYVKEQMGWGLKEAKDFVDDFFKRKRLFNLEKNFNSLK